MAAFWLRAFGLATVPVELFLVSWVTVAAPAALALEVPADVPPLVSFTGLDFPSTVVVPVLRVLFVVAPPLTEPVAGSDFTPPVLLSL